MIENSPLLLYIKAISFGVASALLFLLSRASIRRPRSHGFFRFFAFETILILVLFNINVWILNPLSWHQIVSWMLLSVSLYLILSSVLILKATGKQDPNRDDAPLLEFEKTTRLVTSGVYRFIRHPMYSSLLSLTWGIFFKAPGWIGFILALLATSFLITTARAEEIENLRFFGEGYRAYMQKTRMFIPYIF